MANLQKTCCIIQIKRNVPQDSPRFSKAPEDFLLQFDALMELNEEEKKVARAVLDGLVMRHQARKLMQPEKH